MRTSVRPLRAQAERAADDVLCKRSEHNVTATTPRTCNTLISRCVTEGTVQSGLRLEELESDVQHCNASLWHVCKERIPFQLARTSRLIQHKCSNALRFVHFPSMQW